MAYETINLSAPNDELGDTAREGGQKINDNFAQSYGKFNILGTVSQSAGVPTGAIIERGSNSNGEYVKFADGTMICIRDFLVPGDGARTTYVTYDWPATFINNDYAVIGSATTFGYLVTNIQAVALPSSEVGTNPSTTTSNSSAVTVTTGGAFNIRFTAIGRWY